MILQKVFSDLESFHQLHFDFMLLSSNFLLHMLGKFHMDILEKREGERILTLDVLTLHRLF